MGGGAVGRPRARVARRPKANPRTCEGQRPACASRRARAGSNARTIQLEGPDIVSAPTGPIGACVRAAHRLVIAVGLQLGRRQDARAGEIPGRDRIREDEEQDANRGPAPRTPDLNRCAFSASMVLGYAASAPERRQIVYGAPFHRGDIPKAASRSLRRASCQTLAPQYTAFASLV